MIRKFNIPGDLPKLAALGIVRMNHWPASEIAQRLIDRRLTYLEACLEHGLHPDVKGRRWEKDGRVTYDCKPLPADLTQHAEDLAVGVRDCRALLGSGKLDAAKARLEGVEVLVADMAQLGWRKIVAGQRKGGAVRAEQGVAKARRALELLDSGLSSGQVAAQLNTDGYDAITGEGVRKIKQRAVQRGWRQCTLDSE